MESKIMKNTIKLQLDSSALERLIGGDSEIEVELRSNVVQAFAKRHLKGVIEERYLDELKKEICDYFWEYNSKIYELKPEIKQKIADEVKKAIREEIKKATEEGYKEIVNELNAEIRLRINEIVDWIKGNLNEGKGEEIITKVIKEKLRG